MAGTTKKSQGGGKKKTGAHKHKDTAAGKTAGAQKKPKAARSVRAGATNKGAVTTGTKAKTTRTKNTKRGDRTPARAHGTRVAAAAGLAAAASAPVPPEPAMEPPPHILVFVPGFLGSQLRDKRTGKIVWLDFTSVPLNPLEWEGWLEELFNAMLYPNPNLEPAGLVNDVIFLPPWIKQEQYGRLLKMFEDWGYSVDPQDPNASAMNAYTFPYDWRQDQRLSARQLGERLKELRALHPGKQVWLMGHSGGGIISRWLIEKEGGDKLVDRLFLLASPWDGSPKAVYMLFQGLDTFFRVRFNAFGIPERTRSALRTFPAMYQLIPQARPFLKRATGQMVDPFEGSSWLEDSRDRTLLADGRRFNQELGNHLTVKDTVAFLGRKLETTTGGIIELDESSHWRAIEWTDSELGDGTLPEYSAFFEDARVNVPVVADHGEIYISPALMDLLRVELIDKYIQLQTETLEDKKPKTNATATLDRDVYLPGEKATLRIRLHAVKDAAPVKNARCRARVNWLQGLPGGSTVTAPPELPAIVLTGSADTEGVYQGSFTAPATEGYYQVETRIEIPRQPDILVQDMFVVEQE